MMDWDNIPNMEYVSLGGYYADLGLAHGNAQARLIFFQKPTLI